MIAAGITVHEALKAYETLKSEGIAVRVIDAYSVKPIDRETLHRAARDTQGKLVVVEDHWFEGGLGDAVLDAFVGTRVDGLACDQAGRPRHARLGHARGAHARGRHRRGPSSSGRSNACCSKVAVVAVRIARGRKRARPVGHSNRPEVRWRMSRHSP